MAVTGRNSFRGVAVLVVRQRDGTLAHLPEWMSQPEAELLSITDEMPRISVIALAGLRATVDAVLASATTTRRAEHEMAAGLRRAEGPVCAQQSGDGPDPSATSSPGPADRGVAGRGDDGRHATRRAGGGDGGARKITPDHLARGAYVYVRQSTADQLLHNHESRRRQYGLAERARQLGWSEVVVIDDDLGRSGGGVNRPGFERLLAAICEGRVGAVLAVEASRLARNGRDWHTLLEFCGLVGCLIADEDGLYDPRLPNDRLRLGMKGTMSEMELSILRQRSFEALRQSPKGRPRTTRSRSTRLQRRPTVRTSQTATSRDLVEPSTVSHWLRFSAWSLRIKATVDGPAQELPQALDQPRGRVDRASGDR